MSRAVLASVLVRAAGQEVIRDCPLTVLPGFMPLLHQESPPVFSEERTFVDYSLVF